jgi:hypothetical protein
VLLQGGAAPARAHTRSRQLPHAWLLRLALPLLSLRERPFNKESHAGSVQAGAAPPLP